MKFETKIRFMGNAFAAFYSTITRAENYYKCMANCGSDLQKSATNIVYWRILFGIKVRLEAIAVKYQGRLVSHINFKLTDIETACLLNAILPPDNNTYNFTIIQQIRNDVYKSAHQHVFNLSQSPAYLPVTNPVNSQAVNHQTLTIPDAKYMMDSLDNLSFDYSLFSFTNTSKDGRVRVDYKTLEEALEDGSKLEPIILQVDGMGTYQVN